MEGKGGIGKEWRKEENAKEKKKRKDIREGGRGLVRCNLAGRICWAKMALGLRTFVLSKANSRAFRVFKKKRWTQTPEEGILSAIVCASLNSIFQDASKWTAVVGKWLE